MTTPDIEALAKRVAESDLVKRLMAWYDASGDDIHEEAAACITALEKMAVEFLDRAEAAELALTTAPKDAGERRRKAAEEIVSQYLDHIGEWNAGAATDKIAAIIARLTQKEPTNG